MATKLFVGSISWNSKDEDLKEFFSAAGNVVSATILMERDTGRSRGIGFVEMSTEEEAQKAIDELNGKELDGRKIFIDWKRDKERPRD